MIDVAIIDSGINMLDTELCSAVTKGFNIKYVHGKIVYTENYNDLNGHGTYCAMIIKRLCPDVKLTIIKILDENKMGQSECLLEALNYLYYNPVNIINMSLAIQDVHSKHKLCSVCNKLRKRGTILVSSLANHREYSYPAIFDDVIGVKGSLCLKEREYIYHSNRAIQCQSSSIPILVERMDGTYTFFGGNSKAAANVSGIIADMIQKYGFEKDYEKNFENYACRKIYDEQKFNIDSLINKKVFISDGLRSIDDFEKLGCIMQSVLEIPKEKRTLLFECSVLNPKLNIDKNNLGKLVKEIEREWNIKFRKDKINLFSIIDIVAIYRLIKRSVCDENNKK